MQKKESNRAATRVAKRTDRSDRSGRRTAEQTDRGLSFGKEKSLQRIARSTLIASLVLATLFLIPASTPARADEDHDHNIDPSWEDHDRGVGSEIKALREQVAILYSTVSGLQSQITALKTANTVLETRLTSVQGNPALKLGPFISVDPHTEIGVNGPNIIFTGANIHIVSGPGGTAGTGPGLGNLIIGYDEDPVIFPTGGPGGVGNPLQPGDRAGSHNLVIGPGHRFSGYGGLVAGENNSISGFGSSVTGGLTNQASDLASVSGGENNNAFGEGSSVTGGGANFAIGNISSVNGGLNNRTEVYLSSITSGEHNEATGYGASITGGQNNTASGIDATITGGASNSAIGNSTVVIGGQNIIDNKDFSVAPNPPFP